MAPHLYLKQHQDREADVQMKGILMPLAGLLEMIELICAWIAALLIIYVMLTIAGDVVGRYFLNSPIGWAIEFAEYALMAIPFLSMAWLVRVGGHVSIDLVLNALHRRMRYILGIVVNLLATATCGLAAYFAILTTLSQYEREVMTIGIYPIEKYLLISVVAFGLVLTFIEFLRATFRALSEPV